MTREEKSLVDQEVQNLLMKGAIQEVHLSQNHFLSNLFLVPKKSGGHRPVINLKKLNTYIPYNHFKMESISLLKELLRKEDFMCKIDLKDAYLSVPLHQQSQKFVSFKWGEKLYQFLVLCFGLGPAPRIFTKLMKIPIALMRRLNVRLIIYLDDCLILGSTAQEVIAARDTLIFILEHLGFTINFEKLVLLPTQLIEFLGVEVDSINMKLSLQQEKVEGIILQCQMMLSAKKVSIRDLMKLIGRLSSSAIAVLPAPLQYRAIQRQQIQELASSQNYDSLVTLTEEVKEELDWWCQNLLLSNGRSLVQASPQLVIASDASLQGWGAACKGLKTNGQWSPREQDLHINILELKQPNWQ